MNSEAFMDEFVTKPKIGRLPPALASQNAYGKSFNDSMLIKWLLLAVILLILVFMGYKINNFSKDDARLMSLISSTDNIIKAKNPELYFKDSEGTIAGQMVKIAPQPPVAPAVAPSATSSSPAPRDKAAEKELLGIVGKY